MHHEIDSLAYTNRLRYLPPEHKILFGMTLFCLSWAAPSLIQLLITVWITIWIIIYAQIPASVYLKLLAIPLGFWLTSVPALVLAGVGLSDMQLVQSDIFWGVTLGNLFIYISQQGLQQITVLFTRSLVLTACMYFILLTVPFVEIVRILKNIGCPSLITELLTLMYRFIFLLTETASELLTAQQARIGYCNWKTGIRSIGIVVSQMLRRTLENYRQISLGLTSRGFTGELKVWYIRRYKPDFRYIIEAIFGCTLLFVNIGWHYVSRI
ncbi:cobalt ECF transporter T component CbiQ [Lyngbya sp. PCC 8106]|uniref:cobalt ECF transporter T component CbiQ n=1 Tax=Lyngbya sp. (strain PCC 8106) TaxID=313612 RepID=UPI0000EACE7B|nr:cobalt ECF transporter T component CbiQ [Lyngbya sp. PCC 8106]EAW36110.1 Cobalt transport protein [Lyngbya sp. PCC 8106]